MNNIEILNLCTYFIIYSFLGWVMESLLKTWIQKKPVNSGFLYGPFCPIYGFGAIIMLLFLDRFKNNIIVLFLIAFLVLSIWEYIVGWLLEKIFHTKYWDYTEIKYNIHGRVCLMNSLFWGFLGVVFTKYMHPIIEAKIAQIPNQILVFITSTTLLVMFIDTIISAIKVINIRKHIEKLKDITNMIKEKLEEKDRSIVTVSKENVQEIIDDLKYKQTKLKRKSNRLKKAFPSIKSDAFEKLNEFVKEKKENVKKGKIKGE